MFEDSLVESSGRFRSNRGKTTTLAFVMQFTILGILILIPLIYTEALPKQQLMTFLVAPPPPPPPPPPPAAVPVKVVKVIQTDIINGQLRTPTKIPKKVEMIKEEEAPPPVMASAGVVGGVPGGVPGGQMGGVIGGIISSTPMPKVAAPQRVRVSQGVTSGLLVHRVQPNYPPLARQARIQGSVVLQAERQGLGHVGHTHFSSHGGAMIIENDSKRREGLAGAGRYGVSRVFMRS